MTRPVATLLLCLIALAMVGPLLAPYAPTEHHREYLFAPPMPPRIVHEGALQAPFVYGISLQNRLTSQYHHDKALRLRLPWFTSAAGQPVFLLGSDGLGRDVLSRLLAGARVSLSLAIAAVLLTVLLGTVLGSAAGYSGGGLALVTMGAADFVMLLPLIYVVVILRAVMPVILPAGTVFVLMVTIFALVGWPFVARGVRGIVAAERLREYVLAAEALGAGRWEVLRRHLFPACVQFLFVQATILLPAFILAEATLSYVGFGFPEDVATWGTMLREANVSALSRFPWLLAPAAAIFLVVLATNSVLPSDKIAR